MNIVDVQYREARDASGLYRWWTPAMEQVGQFEHANTLEEIRERAAKEFPNVPDLEINLVEAED